MISCIGRIGIDAFGKHRSVSLAFIGALVFTALVLVSVSLKGAAAPSWHTIVDFAWTHGGSHEGFGTQADYGLHYLADNRGVVASYQCDADDFVDAICSTSCHVAGDHSLNAAIVGVVACGVSLLLVLGQLAAATTRLATATVEAALKFLQICVNIAAVVAFILALTIWNNVCVKNLPDSFEYFGATYAMKYNVGLGTKLVYAALPCLFVAGILNLITPVTSELITAFAVCPSDMLVDNKNINTMDNKSDSSGGVVAIAVATIPNDQVVQNSLL